MTQVLPALLCQTEAEYAEIVDKLVSSIKFRDDWVHIDFADNKFVQNKSIEPAVLGRYPMNLNIEAHLMVENPKEWVEELEQLKVKRILAHWEVGQKKIKAFLKTVSVQRGVCLNPETQPTNIYELFDDLDSILVMSVYPGFQGQKFIEGVLSKIEEIKRAGFKGVVGVDGGINDASAKQIADAGADYLCSGSFLLKGELDENLEKIYASLK